MSPWIEKHRPKILAEVKGQPLAVEKVKEFILNFPKNKKGLILSGPPGVGKTTIAVAAANESNAELFELNASDLRNKPNLQEILKPALQQQSLTKSKKIILVDEVDGISATDRGGLSELLTLLEISSFPIIITANDIWDRKLNDLRKKCEHIQLKDISYLEIKDVLINICKKEGKILSNEILTKIAINAKGDLRAAINDLQTSFQVEEPDKIELSERNKETDIFNALRIVFKEMPNNETLKVFDSTKLELDEIILWVEQNIPIEYQGKELYKAMDALSRTDVFKGRIYKQQYWRFMVYETIFLSYAIAAAKKTAGKGFTKYNQPSRVLKIWLANQRYAKRKSIAKKYASYVHIGEKRAINEFPIIKPIIKSNSKIIQELKLTTEEIDYIKK